MDGAETSHLYPEYSLYVSNPKYSNHFILYLHRSVSSNQDIAVLGVLLKALWCHNRKGFLFLLPILDHNHYHYQGDNQEPVGLQANFKNSRPKYTIKSPSTL